MRLMGLGLGSAAVCLLLASPALAEPIQQNRPLFVNDHDGGVIPNRVSDPDFIINPDGDDQDAQSGAQQANQDQDEDGDISMYQGQDDSVPA
ncbi:MAG: hypothetical protein JSR55_01385 [Proteobacteria bacterium]|nr:hypothetical protein [Pseudomonadota bacterium]